MYRRAILCWLLVTPFLLAQAPASHLSESDVVARCVKALGGSESWAKLQDLEISGSSTSFGLKRTFLEQRKRPNLYRYFYYEGPAESLAAFDGRTAWVKKEFLLHARGPWPMPAEQEQAKWIEVDAEISPPFIDSAARSISLHMTGVTDFDGEPCFEFEVTFPNGRNEHWYIDTQSFLPFVRTREIIYVGIPDEMRIYYSDFREVGGVVLPYKTEYEVGNEYKVSEAEKVSVNTGMDEDIFRMPLPAGMDILQEMAGHFKTTALSPVGPSPKLRETESEAFIRSDLGGALLTETSSAIVGSGFPLEVRRSFTYDRFQDVYRIATIDNSTAHLDVLEGRFDNGVLEVSNLETKTFRVVYDKSFATRLKYYDLSPDGFKLDVGSSLDGGQTWLLERRVIYQRIPEP